MIFLLERHENFQSPVLGVFLCFAWEKVPGRQAWEGLSIPSFRGFSLFRWQTYLEANQRSWLSIPSFRGFSLFRKSSEFSNRWRRVFQSPVLGVFLCFLPYAKLGCLLAFDLSIPSFRGFSLFLSWRSSLTSQSLILSIPSFRGFSLFRFGRELLLPSSSITFQSPVLGVFLCFNKKEVGKNEWGFLSIPSFRGFSLFLVFAVMSWGLLSLLSIPSFRGFSLFPLKLNVPHPCV